MLETNVLRPKPKTNVPTFKHIFSFKRRFDNNASASVRSIAPRHPTVHALSRDIASAPTHARHNRPS
jgi:hypothetical protein